MLEDLFLDTCIFLSHAHGFEKFSKLCQRVFAENKYNKYTSETVIGELDRTSRRRKENYKKFILLLDKSTSIEDLKEIIEDLDMNGHLTDNDKNHLLDIAMYLRSQSNSEEMQIRFNTWRKAADLRLMEARKALTKIAPRNGDVWVKHIIQFNINNKNDSEIIMDAFEFSTELDCLCFVTSDYTDIYRNRSFILEKLVDYMNLDPESFEIFHIEDLFNGHFT